ncbi:pilus assembly protein PilI [Escherichia coli]|uniref:type IV pilus biogenesis protein PilI n=1 Tax=Escherichia coli TaxID=562 RepID=UPI0013020D31|nr:pilus assembly protein PilI [Escherichia coli]KAE9822160.1 pilus assembly protein PilI [Escherichia coli]MWK17919.1 pilus assembly protein PilI [Escherichia coli]MWK85976.1 pilus assembly protein PilI [Escherichia coli]MWL96579.1 pilus assembly protein PilI [Escherichia coli]
MMIKILVVSNSGQERIINLNNPAIEALSDNDFAKVTKSLRTSKNRMICIIQDGNRILRWDRSYASHAKNHWRKVAPDSFEILGTIKNLHYLGKQN